MNDRFSYLLQQYLSGKISVAEHDEFFELLATHRYDEQLNSTIQQDLYKGFESSSADLPPHIAQEIVRNIYKAEKNTVEILPLQQTKKIGRRWMAAASVVLILTASFFYLISNRDQTGKNFISSIPANTIIEKNTTAQQKIVTLLDGSTVELKPGSSIYYRRKFDDSLREVYLEGEAFFQVTKNPQRPFLVYYNNLVTKVLGTSFTINTNPRTGNVEVAVKTGRVQVYENGKIIKETGSLRSVILTPNQKAVYEVEKRMLLAALVNTPVPVISHENTPGVKETERFVYEQEKLVDIFRELEEAYGIEIVVENTNLNNCVFTGDVSGRDLFTKLKIICLTTNSSYEVNGTKILVKGVGCN